MNEIKGCMNCGNLSCGNNKKRESAGCGRWKTPTQKINELEEENSELREKNEGFQRVYSRMRDMGFPTFASVKEYAAKLKELEKENAELKGLKDVATLIRANNDTVTTLMQLNNMLVSKNQQLTKAREIIKDLCGMVRELNKPNVQLTNVDYSLSEAEAFLNSEVDK